MNKGILIWGYLASFILLLGAIFDNKGFMAGKVLFLIGFMAFNLGYLIPLFYVIFKENQENRIGVFIISGILGFLIFLTGVSFFAVSWGGGIILIYIGGAILILAILIMILMSRRFYETSIYSWFPVLVFGVFIVVSLLTSMVNRQVMRVFNINNYKSREIIVAAQKQNNMLYTQIWDLDTCVIANKKIIHQANFVNSQTNEMNNYLDELKHNLILKVEGDKYKIFEGNVLDNLFHIQSNVEINSVKRYMLKKDKKAFELKSKLLNYKKQLISLVPDQSHYLSDQINANINVENYQLSRRRYDKTWEMQNFYDFPLVAVINQLTNIQQGVVVIEKDILSYLYTKAISCNAKQTNVIADSSVYILTR